MSLNPNEAMLRSVIGSDSSVQPKPDDVAIEHFLKNLRDSKLVELADLNEFNQDYPGQQVTTRLLGQFLIERELVTPWQHTKLLQGKYQGFFVGGYKLLKRISVGGIAAVFASQHESTGDRVALRILLPGLAKKASHLQRFFKEAVHREVLRHPNLVRIFDVGYESIEGVGELHFMVTEYIDGKNLEQVIRENGPLPLFLVADYIQQAAKALAHAHDHGIIHRNLKPSNLLVNAVGQVKVTNLAVARFLHEEDSESLTLRYKEDKIGTASFMSPEQVADSHNVDARTDIYSLGCTMYYLLTGKPPFFQGGTQVKRMLKHLDEDPVEIGELRADCSEDLTQICKKLMAKKPEDRFADAKEVVERLNQYLLESSQEKAVHEDTVVSRDDQTMIGESKSQEVQDAIEDTDNESSSSESSSSSVQMLAQDYTEQKSLLETLGGGEGVTIADYRIIQQDEGKSLSYCIWRQGEAALLPRTNLIAFVPQGDVHFQMVRWEVVEEHVGDLLIAEPDAQPERFRVESFPSEAQIEAMSSA